MVICGVTIDEKDTYKLKSIGAKDSKLLTKQTREILFEQIKKIIKKYKIIIIPPKEIDGALLSDDLNLNWLEAIKMAEIINELKPDKVIIDCPSNNDREFLRYLKKHLKDKNTEIIAEHKADVIYPVVSAASILAKVTRDREIENLKRKYKVDFGSGYPSDSITREFLEVNHDKYDFFRKTWAPYKQVNARKKQKRLGEF